MDELSHEFLLGDASAIHASAPREQRTDKRDARHILKLLMENRFPAIWQPAVENVELRQLLLHRCRLVRMRARIKNQLDSMAKNEGLLSSRVWSPRRRQGCRRKPPTQASRPRRQPLLFFVDKRTFVIWPIWIPPRLGDDPSISTQLKRALIEYFAIALRQGVKLASSSKPHGVGCSRRSVRSMYCYVYSTEWCVDVLTCIRISHMYGLTIEL